MNFINATMIDPDGKRVGNFAIKDGVIQSVGVVQEGVDLGGAWVLPALVDCNIKPLDDKLSRANLEALDEAAQKGGVGAFLLRPDVTPALNDETTLELVNSQSFKTDLFAALLATKGERLSEIATLSMLGRAIFTRSDLNSYMLARVFEYAKMLQLPLFVHVHNETLFEVGVMNDGAVAFRLGLGGRSKLEEHSEVAKVIEYSEFYGVNVVFQGISTARSLDLIADSLYCYAEVSIHHLLFSDQACEGYNTLAKIDPPLRDEEERQKLLLALHEGKIDLLTSLHSPKSYTLKDLSFDEAAYGIDALSIYLPLAYTKLVKSGIISMEKFLELASANPAALLGLKRGFVKCGYEAKLLLFDPEFESKGVGLYESEPIFGKVEVLHA